MTEILVIHGNKASINIEVCLLIVVDTSEALQNQRTGDRQGTENDSRSALLSHRVIVQNKLEPERLLQSVMSRHWLGLSQ